MAQAVRLVREADQAARPAPDVESWRQRIEQQVQTLEVELKQLQQSSQSKEK